MRLATARQTMSVNLFLAKESKRDLLGAMGGRPAAEEVSLIRSRPKTVNVPPKPLSQGLDSPDRKKAMTPAANARRPRSFMFDSGLSRPEDPELARKLTEFHARYRLSAALDYDYLDALDRSPDLCATPARMDPSEVMLFVSCMPHTRMPHAAPSRAPPPPPPPPPPPDIRHRHRSWPFPKARPPWQHHIALLSRRTRRHPRNNPPLSCDAHRESQRSGIGRRRALGRTADYRATRYRDRHPLAAAATNRRRRVVTTPP